jgi:major vault protein
MWVYDVELLDVRILDVEVEEMLAAAQRSAIASDITRKEEELRLGDEQLKERVNQEIYAAQIDTLSRRTALELANREVVVACAETEVELGRKKTVGRAEQRAEAAAVEARTELEVAARRGELERMILEAQARAFVTQMEALQPELIATLKTLGAQSFAGELSRNLAPLAILGGESVAAVAERLLDRLPLGKGSNGAANPIHALLAEVASAVPKGGDDDGDDVDVS